jgi:hypothetical protein
MIYKRGWRKDKLDRRDFLHRPTLIELPPVADLSAFKAPVRDQGNVGSCTGHGIGGILTSMAIQQKVFKEWFSPTWIYNGGRFIEGTLLQDSGCEPGDCLNWIQKMGCLPESLWPYNPNRVDTTSPPLSDDQPALKYPILTYTRVTGGSSGIMSALAEGNFVCIGTPWPDAWMNPIDALGTLIDVTPDNFSDEGHETFLFGYNKATGKFSGQNSWSEGWGAKGCYLMPCNAFDNVFTKVGGYDAYYIKVNWS